MHAIYYSLTKQEQIADIYNIHNNILVCGYDPTERSANVKTYYTQLTPLDPAHLKTLCLLGAKLTLGQKKNVM